MMERWVVIILLILGISTFSGCISEGTGTLVIQITDAPTTLKITEALVTISHVEVHMAGLEGWKTVVEEPQTFELISLENAHELLGSANLSAGYYTQIRLHVDNAIVTIADTEYTRYARINIPDAPDYWVDVVIGVSWFEGASHHDVELTTRFNARTRK